MNENKRILTLISLAVTLWAIRASYAQGSGWIRDSSENLQEWMASSTVRIKAPIPSSPLSEFGTGFFYLMPARNLQKGRFLTLITNWHVISNSTTLVAWLPANVQGKRRADKPIPLNVPLNDTHVFPHPDKSVDLCAIVVQDIVERLEAEGSVPYIKAFDESVLADDKFYQSERQLDSVVMVGYPSTLIDEKNLQPIFRRGCYATAPAFDFNGAKEFLLDIPSYPGSSGSPVFHFDDGEIKDRATHSIDYTFRSRLVLIGVLYAGYRYCPKVEVLEKGTNRVDLAVRALVMNNTALVIKTSRIRELQEVVVRAVGQRVHRAVERAARPRAKPREGVK